MSCSLQPLLVPVSVDGSPLCSEQVSPQHQQPDTWYGTNLADLKKILLKGQTVQSLFCLRARSPRAEDTSNRLVCVNHMANIIHGWCSTVSDRTKSWYVLTENISLGAMIWWYLIWNSGVVGCHAHNFHSTVTSPNIRIHIILLTLLHSLQLTAQLVVNCLLPLQTSVCCKPSSLEASLF